MNFAIPFTRKFSNFKAPNVQIIITYKPKIKELDDFIAQYGATHRIDIIFNEQHIENISEHTKRIQALLEKYPNYKIYVRMPHYSQVLDQLLEDARIPHYYAIYAYKWDIFNGLLNTHTSDIFVTEDLCFQTDLLKKKIAGTNKRLRTYCNVCQTSWMTSPSIKTFFIRPEDIYLYEDIFGVIEFFKPKKQALNVLFDVYNKKKRWAGPLKEIIVNYESDEDSNYILPSFGDYRLNCGRRCTYSTCDVCGHVSSLGKTLEEKQIAIIYNKENLLYNKEKDKKDERPKNTN